MANPMKCQECEAQGLPGCTHFEALQMLEALQATAEGAIEKFRVSFVLSFNDRSLILSDATAARKSLAEGFGEELPELANAVEMLAVAMFLSKNQRDQDGLHKIHSAAKQMLTTVKRQYFFGEPGKELKNSIDDLWDWIHRNTNNKFEML